MRVLVAPNAFKGSLTATKSAAAMAEGVRRAAPMARIDLMPISDGGDGLMEVLLGQWGGRRIWLGAHDALGRSCRCWYGLLKDGTAVIEMAQASGLWRLKRARLDPMRASSYGTGELIRDALDRGALRIIVGMGGSATNDGGAGMAQALGAKLLDAKGRELRRGAGALSSIFRIDVQSIHPRIRKAEIIAVSDIRNRLLGEFGSARVFGPQKGATPAQVIAIESALAHYAAVIKRSLGKDVANIPGSAAAGGLGAGLLAFLNAKLVPGARWVLSALAAKKRLAGSDLVLTGEGRLDQQSFYGKAPYELARSARKYGASIIFICGQLEQGLGKKLESLDSPETIQLGGMGEDLDKAMVETSQRLRTAAFFGVRDFLNRGQ
jgi:glycerate kinase